MCLEHSSALIPVLPGPVRTTYVKKVLLPVLRAQLLPEYPTVLLNLAKQIVATGRLLFARSSN